MRHSTYYAETLQKDVPTTDLPKTCDAIHRLVDEHTHDLELAPRRSPQTLAPHQSSTDDPRPSPAAFIQFTLAAYARTLRQWLTATCCEKLLIQGSRLTFECVSIRVNRAGRWLALLDHRSPQTSLRLLRLLVVMLVLLRDWVLALKIYEIFAEDLVLLGGYF